MNFSVYLDDEMVERLNCAARESRRTRNAVVREAVAEWLGRWKPSRWPAEILKFHGSRGIARFEDGRKALKPPREPFDAVSA